MKIVSSLALTLAASTVTAKPVLGYHFTDGVLDVADFMDVCRPVGRTILVR